MQQKVCHIWSRERKRDVTLKILLFSFHLMHKLNKCLFVWPETTEACSTTELPKLSQTNILIMCFLPKLDFESQENNTSTKFPQCNKGDHDTHSTHQDILRHCTKNILETQLSVALMDMCSVPLLLMSFNFEENYAKVMAPVRERWQILLAFLLSISV